VSEITSRLEALIVTRGAAGSVVHTRGEKIEIPAAPARQVVDPTGCGDAFRAGLIHGLLHGRDWRTTGHIASLMGAIKIESRGTQNHRFSRDEFSHRLGSAFG
jgi:adenosine kinase